jgi:hypothetical protein
MRGNLDRSYTRESASEHRKCAGRVHRQQPMSIYSGDNWLQHSTDLDVVKRATSTRINECVIHGVPLGVNRKLWVNVRFATAEAHTIRRDRRAPLHHAKHSHTTKALVTSYHCCNWKVAPEPRWIGMTDHACGDASPLAQYWDSLLSQSMMPLPITATRSGRSRGTWSREWCLGSQSPPEHSRDPARSYAAARLHNLVAKPILRRAAHGSGVA